LTACFVCGCRGVQTASRTYRCAHTYLHAHTGAAVYPLHGWCSISGQHGGGLYLWLYLWPPWCGLPADRIDRQTASPIFLLLMSNSRNTDAYKRGKREDLYMPAAGLQVPYCCQPATYVNTHHIVHGVDWSDACVRPCTLQIVSSQLFALPCLHVILAACLIFLIHMYYPDCFHVSCMSTFLIRMLLVAGGSVAPAALLACLGPPLLPRLSAHLHQWPACRWLVRDGPSVLLCSLGGGSFTCVLHSAGWRPCCVVYYPSRVHVVCCWHRRLGLLPDADVYSVREGCV
jgi:hypothetical protein